MNQAENSKPNDLLRGARKELKWTQEELAEKLDVIPLTVYRWENGLSFPSAYYRLKLCDLFKKNEADLGLIQSRRYKRSSIAESAQSNDPVNIVLDENEIHIPSIETAPLHASDVEQDVKMPATQEDSLPIITTVEASESQAFQDNLSLTTSGETSSDVLLLKDEQLSSVNQQSVDTHNFSIVAEDISHDDLYRESHAVTSTSSQEGRTEGHLIRPDDMPQSPLIYTNNPNLSLEDDVATSLPSPTSSTDKPASHSRRVLLIGGAILGEIILVGGVAEGVYQILSRQASSKDASSVGTTTYIYEGHSAGVETVKWSPDGKRVASCGGDHTVHIWDPFNRKQLSIYRGHSNTVFSIAWSPDGKRVASASEDGTVHVWHADSGKLDFMYTHHKNRVHDVAWSPDGKSLASASFDTTIQVWDARSGEQYFTYHGHQNWVTCVAWSPDNSTLLSGSYDTSVQGWNAKTGKALFSPFSLSAFVETVAWSPDGKYFAAGGETTKASVWGAPAGNNIYTYSGHTKTVRHVAWSPNSIRLASGSLDHTVQIWDALTGEHPYVYKKHSDIIVGVDWSPDGNYIASGSYDRTVHIWRARE